jgi:hypothetical protein
VTRRPQQGKQREAGTATISGYGQPLPGVAPKFPLERPLALQLGLELGGRTLVHPRTGGETDLSGTKSSPDALFAITFLAYPMFDALALQ